MDFESYGKVALMIPAAFQWPFLALACIIAVIVISVFVFTHDIRQTRKNRSIADFFAEVKSALKSALKSKKNSKAGDNSYNQNSSADDSSQNANPGSNSEEITVWNIENDLETENASAQLQIWHKFSNFGTVLLLLCAVLTAVVTGRPSSVNDSTMQTNTRDIVLCLDVSGSALPYDHEIIKTYRQLVSEFNGERIAMSIFNSTSRTIFPLTDDYDVIKSQLEYAESLLEPVQTQDDINAMSDESFAQLSDWLSGTQNITDSTSLIGDGLVSCAVLLPQFSANFDKRSSAANEIDSKRDASIVFSSDNVVSGKPAYTLEQALSTVTASGISVDALYIGAPSTSNSSTAYDLKEKVTAYGGICSDLNQNRSINEMVREINKRRAGSDEFTRGDLTDAPALFLLAVSAAFLFFLNIARKLQR